MHERAAREAEPDGRRRPKPSRGHALAALQRAVGNRGMAGLVGPRTLARRSLNAALATPELGIPEPAAGKGRVDLVFIMGDHKKDDFYASAHQYYKKAYPKAKLITGVRTLADVIKTANASRQPIENLFIVSHGNLEGTMYFKLTAKSKDARILHEDLLDDLSGKSALPQANTKVLDDKTTVRIKGCNVGRSSRMLNLLDRAFGGKVTVIAPTHSQLFGRRTQAEALGEYYVVCPGKVRLLPDQVLKLFKEKYPWVSDSEWRALEPHMKETVIEDPIPVNNMAIAPRNSAHTERWFKSQPDFRSLRAAGYTDAHESKRETVGAKVKIEITVTGPDVDTKKLTYTFDKRDDAALIKAAEARLGLPGISDLKVEQRAADSIDLSVVARRTVWEIHKQPISVGGKDVRGGRAQGDWYQSSTYP